MRNEMTAVHLHLNKFLKKMKMVKDVDEIPLMMTAGECLRVIFFKKAFCSNTSICSPLR